MPMNNGKVMQTRILLIDDHAILRKGLHLLLEKQDDFTVIGEAADGEAGIDLIHELSPDVVIMDITMPGLNGIEATKKITAKYPDTRVITLSIHSERKFIEDMLQAGAAGYILKESIPEDLVRGIRSVMSGAGYLSPSITGIVVSGYRESFKHEHALYQADNDLIETKLHVPQLPEDHVHRQRLVSILTKNIGISLQTVTAPAGYGKSTLVSCWLLKQQFPYSWISLDERDNDLRQFITYFVHAVQRLIPGSMSNSLTLLKAANLPPVPVLATLLVNEIEQIKLDFILAIDDFHCITEKNINDLVAELLRHPPKSMHLIVVSRTEPFLPLGKLRAQGLLAEIRLQDLRFTDQETAMFLQTMLKHDFALSDSYSLNKKAEGWITGIRLAALSLLHRNDVNSIIGELEKGGQYVMEYLFHEVLASQPENLRRHLACASLFDRFCAPLFETICPSDKNEDDLVGWEFIKLLKKNNLFLIPLDNDGFWYRFHHLFQDLLKKQVQRHFSPDEIATLHAKASGWFADNDLIEEAIRHSLNAGDIDGAVRLIELHRQKIHNNDQWYILEKWLSMFPETVIQEFPELLVVRMWVFYHHFNIPALPAVIDDLERQMNNSTEKRALLGEIHFFKGYLLYFQNDGLGSLQHLQDALNMIPEANKEVRGQVELLYGLASQMLGKKNKAMSRLHELLTTSQRDRSAGKTRLLIMPVYLHILSGDLPEARIANQQLFDFSCKGKYLYAEAWSLYLHGLICFFQNDLDQAIAYFRQAIHNKYVLHTRATVDSMVGLCLAYQAKGESDMARSSSQELLDYVSLLHDPVYTMIARLSQIRLSIQQGLLQPAVKWRQQVSSAGENMIWWLEIPRISYCRALLADGAQINLEQAATSLAEILLQNEANHNICQMIQVLPLLALVQRKLGNREEALVLLGRAVGLAEEGVWIQPFVELGEPMKEMLLQLHNQNIESLFVDQLVGSFPDESQKAAGMADEHQSPARLTPDSLSPLESLTSREEEILELLVQGLANKVIAQKLFVSIDTVKTHLRNIYKKLNVTSRLQAVAKGQVDESSQK